MREMDGRTVDLRGVVRVLVEVRLGGAPVGYPEGERSHVNSFPGTTLGPACR
jgi:hypothetical protein